MQEDKATEQNPSIKPCGVCGSTEFKSVKALMFLSSSQKGEVSIGKDVSLKVPITSSTIFEKYHNEKPFSHLELVLSWLMLIYSMVFLLVAAIQSGNGKLPISDRLLPFGISTGFFMAAVWLKSRHKKLRSKWWNEIDSFKERLVCLRCAHEWRKGEL